MTFKEFFKDCWKKFHPMAEPGLVIALLLFAMTFFSGDMGVGATKLLIKFVDHAVPTPALFTPAFVLGAIGTLFYGSEVAKLIRGRVNGVMHFLAHSAALGCGMAAGLFLASLVPDHPRGLEWRTFLVATVILAVVFIEARAVSVALDGKLDRMFGRHAERVWAVVGLIVLIFAIYQGHKELIALASKPSEETKTTSAPCQSATARSPIAAASGAG